MCDNMKPSRNWKRWAIVAIGGVLAAATAVVPPLAVVTVPVLGKVGIGALIAGASAYFAGVATKTPGYVRDPREEITAKTGPRI